MCPDASIDEITDFLCAAQMPKPKRKFFEREFWKRKKQMRYEKRMMSEDSETIRLPKPMIGFGVPMESSQTFHRTLPEAAMGCCRRSPIPLPLGTLGWSFLGETICFISCAYSDHPKTFMDRRRHMYGRTADFFDMLLFGATVLTGIVLIEGMIPYVSESFAKIIFMSNSLTFMMVDVWSKQNPFIHMSFWGLFTFTVAYLPWALASERELVLALLDPDAMFDSGPAARRFSSKGLESDIGKNETDLTFVLDRIFEGVCRPFKVRIEQVLQSQPSIIISYKLSNTLEFYSYTISDLLGRETALCNTLWALKDASQKTFFDILKTREEKLLRYPPLAAVDLSPPPAVREGVPVLLEIIETDDGMMVPASGKKSDFDPVISALLDPIIQICEQAAEAHKSKGAIPSFRRNRTTSDPSQLSKSPVDAILANNNTLATSQVYTHSGEASEEFDRDDNTLTLIKPSPMPSKDIQSPLAVGSVHGGNNGVSNGDLEEDKTE
ncbi:unnamed protein product [Camellia sinensis]